MAEMQVGFGQIECWESSESVPGVLAQIGFGLKINLRAVTESEQPSHPEMTDHERFHAVTLSSRNLRLSPGMDT